MTFRELQQRFVETLRERVRSGEITERRLARLVGVSQPHMHNVLKGRRTFSIESADQVLSRLHLDVIDLIEPIEWAEHQRRQ